MSRSRTPSTSAVPFADDLGGIAGQARRHHVLITVLLALVATLAGLCVPLAAAQARSSTATPPLASLTRLLLSDTFNRTVRSGWGAAPLGGAYHGAGSNGRAMAVAGNAYFSGVAAGHSRVQRSSVTASDVVTTATVNFPRIPRRGSWTAYVGLELRVQSNGTAYSATVRVGTRGRARLLLDRRPAHGASARLTSRTLPLLHAGRTYTLQAAVVGNRLWTRIYRAGYRPGSWLTAADTSRSAIRSAGRIGIVLATVGRRTSSSVRFGSLNAYGPARTTSAPTPPVSTPPTSTPPTSTPPTSTPPTSTPPTSTPPTSTPPTSTPPTSTPPTSTPPTSTPPTGTSHADQVIANAGTAPLGTTSYPVPADAIVVSPSGNDSSGTGTLSAPYATVTRALKAATSGATIVLRGGVYHESVYVRANLQVTIESYPGEVVWFDGSVPVTSWTQVGSDWVHTGWDAQFDHSASFTKGSNAGGFVNSAYPMAAWPDQVFVDGVQLAQVAANPSAGEFAVDYANKQLIVGSDPSGHAVRASDLSQAFVVAGQNTILRGFGIRRYATSLPQIGTLYLGGNGGNLVQNVVIDNSAGQGLASSSYNNIVDHVTLTNNGMSGMSNVYSNGAVIENSLISGNNTQHFNSQPSAAGLKITRLDGVVVRDNLVEDNNDITGIWTDENVTHFTITGNVVRDNGNAYGIENELSDTGIVANNVVSGSKYGITAYDSGDISIYNNDVNNNRVWDIGLTQDNRWQPGKGTAGPKVQPSAANPWLVQNVTVADNNIGRAPGMFQFYVLDKQTNRSADSMNLMVAGNQFAPRTSSAQPWAIGWGMGDNTTVHTYATADAFNAGESKTWPNTMASAGTGYASASTATSVAQPLPADVAAAIGQSAGVKHIGTF